MVKSRSLGGRAEKKEGTGTETNLPANENPVGTRQKAINSVLVGPLFSLLPLLGTDG
jgi:hypothetical protein